MNRHFLFITLLLAGLSGMAQVPHGVYASSNVFEPEVCMIFGDSLVYVHQGNGTWIWYYGFVGKYSAESDTLALSGNCLYSYNAAVIEDPCDSDSLLFFYTLPLQELFAHRMFLSKDGDTLKLKSIGDAWSQAFYLDEKDGVDLDYWLDTPVTINTFSSISCSKLPAVISRGKKYTVAFRYADEFVSYPVSNLTIIYNREDGTLTAEFDADEKGMSEKLWKQEAAGDTASVDGCIKMILDKREAERIRKYGMGIY